jgi:hypothetical protein
LHVRPVCGLINQGERTDLDSSIEEGFSVHVALLSST